MTVVGISMVKDEIDILPYTIKHMLTQVDQLIIMDDGSSDGTYEFLVRHEEYGNKLLIPFADELEWRDGYYQSEKMTALVPVTKMIFMVHVLRSLLQSFGALLTSVVVLVLYF